jgi:hypothetical protein
LIKFKIILQLLNGTIVTLLLDQENCGTMMDDNGFDNRVMTGSLCFEREYSRAKSSPVIYDENQVFNRK